MKYLTPGHRRADELLQEIAETERRIKGIEAQANTEIAEVKSRHAEKLGPLSGVLKGLEKQLRSHMKKRRDDLFGGSDRVDLEHGALLHGLERRVKRARGVLQKLEEHGFEDAIKIAKSVDWDALESWPVERLVLVGTERVQKESFEYELRAGE